MLQKKIELEYNILKHVLNLIQDRIPTQNNYSKIYLLKNNYCIITK